MDPFEDILRDLGAEWNLSLHPDQNRACLLYVNDFLHIQLEFNEELSRLLVLSFLGPLPAGRFREQYLAGCLMANHPLLEEGMTLGFFDRANELALFRYLYSQEFRLPELPQLLLLFIEKATLWKSSLARGELPLPTASPSSLPRPPFLQ